VDQVHPAEACEIGHDKVQAGITHWSGRLRQWTQWFSEDYLHTGSGLDVHAVPAFLQVPGMGSHGQEWLGR